MLVKPKARVQHSYNPEHDDELKLEVGDLIEVLKQEEEGWWEGNLNGRVGMFPSNFVELVETPENTEKVDESKDQTQFREIKGKKVQGVGLGNIFGGGPIKLRPSSVLIAPGKKTEHVIDAPESKEEKTAVNSEIANKRDGEEVQAKRERTERAIVRYSYSAENEDELSLEVGDVINVLDTCIEDTGWWKGELNGKIGVFPDNFVEMLPHEEVKPKKPPPPTGPKIQKTEPTRPVTPPTSEKKVDGDFKSNVTLQTILDRKSELRSSQVNHVQPEQPVKKKDAELLSPGDKSLIPSKKPALPPPVGRKPNQSLRHSDHPKIESKAAGKAKSAIEPSLDAKGASETKTSSDKSLSESKTEKVVSEDDTTERTRNTVNLDSVEPSEKLTHPTAHRAKLPNRRPPSQALFLTNDDDKTNNSSHPERPPPLMTSSVDDLKDEPVKETKKLSAAPSSWVATTTAPAVGASMKRGSIDLPPRVSVDTTNSVMASSNQTAIEELRKELQALKASTVSKSSFNELRAAHEKLQKDVDTMKAMHQKRIVELMNEIDEEKKGRLNIQVQIERIRKLALESSA